MYLDTSVLVKLFVREPDSEHYGGLVHGQVVSTCALAYTETWSALLAKERAREITAAQRRRAWTAFERNVAEELIDLIPLGFALFKRANRALELCHPTVPLRSVDAIHLAAADQVQDWPIATADRRMRDAAELLDYPLTPLS